MSKVSMYKSLILILTLLNFLGRSDKTTKIELFQLWVNLPAVCQKRPTNVKRDLLMSKET
jgi:hypothetical protein